MNSELHTEPCLWEKLHSESRPIFLYGTGNGADKILDVCEKYRINIEGVFASSGFVRNRTFRDMPVRSLDDIRADYGDDIIVLLAFGTTLDSVIENIRDVARKHTLYIPEVPLYRSELFDRRYYIRNIEYIEKAEELFSDSESKYIYRDMISFRLSGEPRYLSRVMPPRKIYSSLINEGCVHNVIDCGAYKGDSAADILASLSPETIYAMEPDPKTFIKLSSYADSVSECKIIPMNYAAGIDSKAVEFNSSGSRGSGTEGMNKRGKTSTVQIRSIDSLELENIDLIKFDVEGDEFDAINGALKTMKKFRPALSISVYHRSEDIFKIPLLIKELCPDYYFYLRRVPCIPAWDISLIAVPENMIK